MPTYVHDYPFSEITKAVRWTLDALPDNGITSAYVENRFKGNQNWNVAGSTGLSLPGATPTLYSVGDKVVAGVEVITTNADQITYVSGVLNSGNNTGILRRRYAKDAAGLITKSTQYGGIKLPDGSQLQALVDDITTNGVRITEDGSDVVVDVDLSVVTTGFRFFGMSDERGVWADINDDDSKVAIGGIDLLKTRRDVTSSRSPLIAYKNKTATTITVKIITTESTNAGTLQLDVNGSIADRYAHGDVTTKGLSVSSDVLPGEEYSYSISGTLVIEKIIEIGL